MGIRDHSLAHGKEWGLRRQSGDKETEWELEDSVGIRDQSEN